jgi:hypothetical protein
VIALSKIQEQKTFDAWSKWRSPEFDLPIAFVGG